MHSQESGIVSVPNEDMEFGRLVAGLVESNIRMWDNQDRIYDFDNIPEEERADFINRSAALNIHRNDYMDAIDRWFTRQVESLGLAESS